MFYFSSGLKRNLNNFISLRRLFIITGTTELGIRNYIFYVLLIDHFTCLGNHIEIILREIREMSHGWITCVMHRWFHATPASPEEISQSRDEVCAAKSGVSQSTHMEIKSPGSWLMACHFIPYWHFYLDNTLFLDGAVCSYCAFHGAVLKSDLWMQIKYKHKRSWHTKSVILLSKLIVIFFFLHGLKMSWIKIWV